MALTQTEKHLINGLKVFEVEKEAILGIVAALRTEKQQWAMINYLVNNRQATQSDILLELVKIAK